MNKIILKVEVTSKTTADVTLLYVDNSVLAFNNNVFISYYDLDENFVIYSTNNDKMSFTRTAFKLPCLSKYVPNEKIEISFQYKEELHKWLKQLYRTLHKWNLKAPEFKKINEQDSLLLTKMKITNDFWIL